MNTLKLIVGLIVATVLVVFVAQNPQLVTLHFLTFKLHAVPMVFALFVAALLGALLGWIVSAPGRFRRMRERRGLRGKIATNDRATAAASEITRNQES